MTAEYILRHIRPGYQIRVHSHDLIVEFRGWQDWRLEPGSLRDAIRRHREN